MNGVQRVQATLAITRQKAMKVPVGHTNGIPTTLAIGLGRGRGLLATDQGSTSRRVLVRRISLRSLTH